MQKRANRLLSAILVLVLVFSMLPVSAFATEDSDPLAGWSITLCDKISANFYFAVEDPTNTVVKITVGGKSASVNASNVTKKDNFGNYAFTVNLATAQMTDEIGVEMLVNGVSEFSDTYTIQEYAQYILADPEGIYTDAQKELVLDMLYYGAAAQTHFAYNTGSLANAGIEGEHVLATVPNVEPSMETGDANTGISLYGRSLLFQSRLAVRFYFELEDGKDISSYTFTDGNGKTYTPGKMGSYYVVDVTDINPQDMADLVTMNVFDGSETMTVTYSPLHYIIRMYHKDSSSADLKALLQEMYTYHLEAVDYTSTVVDKLLTAESWNNGGTVSGDTLTVAANSQITAAYLKSLWDEGYTHLVFTVNAAAASDNNTNFTHSGTWSRYWQTFAADTDIDLRIDLNEFHDGDTWYSINFNAGEMTVSNPIGYKSAETLSWTKSSTNVYFAIEDGYYVLETRGNDANVISPTEWLAKYMVSDDGASQRTFKMYTDYINQGSNTRSMIWGWGSPENTICGDVNGGWSWNNNVSADNTVFSLQLDTSGVARFKLLDWVSNRNEWNGSLGLSYVDAQTIKWSAAADYKLRLATTQDLIAAGYNTLRVTLTGDLGSAMVWYGGDAAWGDNEFGISATDFADGTYTFNVDLTTYNSTESFFLMASGGSFTELQIKVEPLTLDIPVVYYSVSVPSSDDYIIVGENTVEENQDYTFTVAPVVDSTVLTVYVNGQVLAPVSQYTYVVESVTADLTVTVDADLFAVEDVILNPENWSADSTLSSSALTTASNSQLSGSALKQLWDEGYTHLVFTIQADNATNYIHSGNWQRYWQNLSAGTTDIRIDLNEFHDGDTWYSVDFTAGEMIVSNPIGYKSAETLSWTKSSTNVYFAIEDGYYVLETRGYDTAVISPTEWLKKYVVADDANQRTWMAYTDYITQGDNTRSVVWGWGEPTGTYDIGQWSAMNNVQQDGYTEGEVFSLQLDKAGVARFKISDFISNRNTWGTFSYSQITDNSITFSGDVEQKIRYAATDELIAAGYTALKVTFNGNIGDSVIYFGNDTWGDGKYILGVSANELTETNDYTYTVNVDLSQMNGNPFTLQVAGAAVTDMKVTVEPTDKLVQYPVKLISVVDCELDGESYATAGQDYTFSLLNTDANVTLGTVTVNGTEYEAVDGVYTVPAASVTGGLVIRVENATITNAIVAADGSYNAAADLMETELDAVSGDRGVYTKRANITYTNSILLGVNTEDAKVTNETYTVSGDGTNIYIDGNCKRAVAYGVADYLRSLGYEFYTADITTRPESLSLDYSMAELTDTADFAVRSYLSNATGYNENSLTDQAFTVLSKNNNSLVACYDNFGGGIEIEDFGGGVHNFDKFFADHTEGKYGYTVSTGVGSETGFAPCLTNGITYNVGGTDTTLTYAVARMKAAILANPDADYYSFCQNDGPTHYCACEHCTADAETYNRSGTLVNFINAMIAQIEADPDLSGKDFKILTFAYSFSAEAPANVSSASDKLHVWFAEWHNANYAINSESQDLNDYTANLNTWASLTADGNLSLWLYDAAFNNYLAYFPSINTIAANIQAAKDLGVSNILVQGAWNAEPMWQAEMKSYIWSKLLWDSSLDVATLQTAFLKAYFGEAALTSVQTFVDLYDDNVGDGANITSGYPICSGYGYYSHVDVYSLPSVHAKALDAANAAIDAIAADTSLSDEEKALYTQRANELLAMVYGSVIANWTKYEEWSTGHYGVYYEDRFDDFANYFGSTVSDCQTLLTNALSAAGITKTCESDMTVTDWISYITDIYNS